MPVLLPMSTRSSFFIHRSMRQAALHQLRLLRPLPRRALATRASWPLPRCLVLPPSSSLSLRAAEPFWPGHRAVQRRAMASGSGPEFRIEEAVTGRAKCKECKAVIDKGQLRIGKVTASAFSDEGTMVTWFHLDCFFTA